MNVNKNLGKEKITNMLPTNVCLFNALSQTILLFGLPYLHLDVVQFLHKLCYVINVVQFSPLSFQAVVLLTKTAIIIVFFSIKSEVSGWI